jgi:outer membrane immunogenic protein
MRKLAFCAATAACLGMATPAMAGGMYEGSMKDAPVPMPVATWTGFYIGAGVGAGAVVHDLDVGSYTDTFKETRHCYLFSGCMAWSEPYTYSENEGSLNFDGIGGEGVFGTVGVGYDLQFAPRAVFGVFGDFDWSGIGTDLDFSYSDGYETVSGETELDMEWMWTIGARLGFLPTPDTLVYGLAGYSQVSFDDADVALDGFDPFTTSLDTFKGWTVGAGMETRLNHNWGLKLEYRFTQLQDEELFSVGSSSETYRTLDCLVKCRQYDEYGVAAAIEPSIHTGRVALTYRFNRAPAPIEAYK